MSGFSIDFWVRGNVMLQLTVKVIITDALDIKFFGFLLDLNLEWMVRFD